MCVSTALSQMALMAIAHILSRSVSRLPTQPAAGVAYVRITSPMSKTAYGR